MSIQIHIWLLKGLQMVQRIFSVVKNLFLFPCLITVYFFLKENIFLKDFLKRLKKFSKILKNFVSYPKDSVE